MRASRTTTSRPAALRRGLTLIEILIVVTMIGIMIAIVAPHFRVTETSEAQMAGMQLVQDVDYARTRALSARALSRIRFDNNSSPSYSGYLDVDGDSTIAETADEMTYLHGSGRVPLPARIQFGRGSIPAIPGDADGSAITFANNRLDFNSRGIVQPIGTSGVIYLRNTNKAQAVVAVQITAAGNVRLWTYRDGTWQ